MIDERIIELYRSQLAVANEEKGMLYAQVKALTEEVSMLRLSMEQSRQATDELLSEIKSLCQRLEEKDKRIADLEEQLSNAQEQNKLGRKKRFVRSSEQARLLNNRDKDVRAEERSDYDGSSNAQLQGNQEEEGHQEQQNTTSKKEAAPRAPKTPNHVDETVVHEVKDYYELPEGARFMKRKGEIDLCYYTVFEYQPAKIIKHVYEVARVQLADGSFEPTMDCPNIVDRCPFSARMFAEMLSWKYVYNLSVNKIRRRLASLGVFLSRSTLNHYLHMGIRAIREKLEELFRNEVKDTDYLMIDETCALIGMVKNDQKSFKKKYIWAFYAHLKKMVYYLYESGSRARKVVTDFLDTFCGYISSDGYVAYSVFDDAEKYPEIIRCGCWTHARRLFVEALDSCSDARIVINDVADLFKVEAECEKKGLDVQARKIERENRSSHIMTRIYCRIKSLSKDTAIMANSLMKKAVTYMLNQWESLRNFILDGRVQLSNNLCEQRMKPIKLNLKVCQNIGSETAAENASFMFSLMESCKLNKLKEEPYMESLFISLGMEQVDWKQNLPCFYKQ
jgi:hypothetical protein